MSKLKFNKKYTGPELSKAQNLNKDRLKVLHL